MRSTSFLGPLFFAATSLAQAVPVGISPSSPPPSGCESNAISNFTIGTLKFGHKSKRESAVEAADSALVCNLSDGVLKDRDGRIGSVVANHQFQFDGPPQAGAIYTGGFSVCSNGSLAIGGTTRWWQCSSGGFFNLYDEWIGAQCEEIRIQVTFPKTGSSTTSVPASLTSVPVASVVSSLATVSGSVSTVSKSAIGPSASYSSGANLTTITSSRASGSSSVTPTRSAASGSPSSSTTSAADAPPAGGAAPAGFAVAKASMLGAFVVIFGAAIVL
ncbi:hypothetical protein IQ06DRAFT_210557 [Phaeosphaeriaceae sp. SRC1lsM3a]|nr:hypothetical protein IQ06DRAFT_210557 [Stagonospora sp. SRC1lsM3a]